MPEYPTTKPGTFLSLISFPSQGRPFWGLLPFSREPSQGEGRKRLCEMYFWLHQLQLNTVSFFFYCAHCSVPYSLTSYTLENVIRSSSHKDLLFKVCIVFYCTIYHNLLTRILIRKLFSAFCCYDNAAINILTLTLYCIGLSTSIAKISRYGS